MMRSARPPCARVQIDRREGFPKDWHACPKDADACAQPFKSFTLQMPSAGMEQVMQGRWLGGYGSARERMAAVTWLRVAIAGGSSAGAWRRHEWDESGIFWARLRVARARRGRDGASD